MIKQCFVISYMKYLCALQSPEAYMHHITIYKSQIFIIMK